MKTKSFFAGIAVLNFIGQSQLHAQATWTGTGTSGTPAQWSVGSNWSANAPVSNSTISLLFNNTAANSFSNNDLTGLTVSSISIPANFGGVNVKDNTITGNAITLSGGVTVATGNFQTIGLNIALASGSGSLSQTTGQTTFSGQISGSEAISKTGGGTVILSGNNNFSGSVTVNGGTLTSSGTNSLGSASGITLTSGAINLSGTNNFAGNVSVASGTTVRLSNNTGLGSTAGRITMAGGGRLELSNNITVTGEIAEIQGNGGDNTNGGVIRNVSGSNTWTGNVITVGNDSRLIAADGTLTISGVISSSNVGNNQVIFRGQGGTIELTNANTYGGTTRVFGTPADTNSVMLRLSGGDNRLPVGTSIDIGGGGVSGHMQISGVSQEVAGLVSNNNSTTTRISGVGTATLVINNAGTGAYTGTLTDSLAFTKSGAGTYTLSGNNNYSRGTTINGGTLRASHVAALGSGTVNFNASSGAVLQLGTDTSVNAYNVSMGSNRFNTIVSDRSTSGAGIVHALGTLSSGSSSLSINKGSNTTGTSAGVSFSSVDLSAGNNDRNVIIHGDGVISLGSVAALSNNIGFTGGLGNGGTVANKVLQLDGTNTANTVTGVISNTNATGSTVVSLVKANTSTWTLQSNNTYTGTTTIKGGTLKLNSSTAIANSSTITVGDTGSSGAVLDVTAAGFTVGSTQTLGGIGTILATGRTVTASGTISAGNSVGVLNIDGGTLALDSTSKFVFELGTSSDLVSLLNLATLNLGSGVIGLSDFTFSNSGGFGDGVYSLISGASSFSGTLDSGNLTGEVLGRQGTLSMSGNNLVLTVVPEPGTILLGSLGLLALLRRRRA